jgi:hypothetical protein
MGTNLDFFDFESTKPDAEFKGKNCNAMRQVEINNGNINNKTEAIECGIKKYQDKTGKVEARKKFYKTILVDYCNKNTKKTCPDADEFGVINNAEPICKELDICDYGMKVEDILTVASEYLGIFSILFNPIDFNSTVEALKFKKNDRLSDFKKKKKEEDAKKTDEEISEEEDKLQKISDATGESVADLKAGKGSEEAKKMLKEAGLITETVKEKDKDVKRDGVDLDEAAKEAAKEEAAKKKAAKEEEEEQTFSTEEEAKIKKIAEDTETTIEDIKAGKGSEDVIKSLKEEPNSITIKSKSVSGGRRRNRRSKKKLKTSSRRRQRRSKRV